MLKVNFFKSLQFFQGQIIWITFGRGALGAETLCLSGVKICHEIPLGRNLGGQVENVCPLGAEKGQSLPSSALRLWYRKFQNRTFELRHSLSCLFQVVVLLLLLSKERDKGFSETS